VASATIAADDNCMAIPLMSVEAVKQDAHFGATIGAIIT
jgi:hypothetical protein